EDDFPQIVFFHFFFPVRGQLLHGPVFGLGGLKVPRLPAGFRRLALPGQVDFHLFLAKALPVAVQVRGEAHIAPVRKVGMKVDHGHVSGWCHGQHHLLNGSVKSGPIVASDTGPVNLSLELGRKDRYRGKRRLYFVRSGGDAVDEVRHAEAVDTATEADRPDEASPARKAEDLVIIPVYNEAPSIPRVMDALR